MGKISIMKEFWLFMRFRKKYWLSPIFIVLALLSLILVFAETSALARLSIRFSSCC